MRNLILGFLTGAVLMAVNAYAATSHNFIKQVNTTELQAELIADGADVKGIVCIGKDDCTIYFGLGGEGTNHLAVISAHTYVNPDDTRAALKTDLEALAAKHRANTITAAESHELTDKMLQYMGF